MKKFSFYRSLVVVLLLGSLLAGELVVVSVQAGKFPTTIDEVYENPGAERKPGFAVGSGWLGAVFSSGFGRSNGPATLIVTTDREEYAEPFTTTLAVWLQAVFSAQVRIIGQSKFNELDSFEFLEDMETIIYYGIDYENPPPESFIEYSFDLMQNQTTKLVWLGYHLEKLEDRLVDYGLIPRGLVEGYLPPGEVFYIDTGQTYEVRHMDLTVIGQIESDLARARVTIGEDSVVASASLGSSAMFGDDFYFFGFHPTAYLVDGGIHLIFVDLMHEVYEISRSKYALVRLEDVSPTSDPSQLKAIKQYFCVTEKPFIISLIPFYLAPGHRLVALREKVELLEVIYSSLGCGAEIVLHGATHQYEGETGVDSEFWDEQKNEPIEDLNFIQARVELALAELEATGLAEANVGWETPHNPYHAAEVAYEYFESRFDLLYEDPRWGYHLGFLPYPLITEEAIYVPTNLGYYQDSLPPSQLDRKLELAEKVQGLQYGGLASFFYHPWLGMEKLGLFTDGLAEQGWEFSPVSSVASEYLTTITDRMDREE